MLIRGCGRWLLGSVALVLVGHEHAFAQESTVLEGGFRLYAQQTDHFQFGSVYGDFHEIAAQSDELFQVVVDRLGISLDYKVRVDFMPPQSGLCPFRGATSTFPFPLDGATRTLAIRLFADEMTSEAQVLAVLAHEVGHVLQFEAVNGGSSIQSIFIEGFATWVAGPYWLDWQGVHSFQSAVKSYLDSGTYISLHENDESFDTTSDDAELRFGRDCLNMRDIIYTEWAAFIDYLVEEYGREKLLSLFQAAPIGAVDDQTRYKQPNFPEIYGASLEQLEVAWLQSLEASD